MNISLTRSIFKVLQHEGTIAGTGFLVSAKGLVLTCSHVIQPIEGQNAGEAPPEQVTLVYLLDGQRYTAVVRRDCWRDFKHGDIGLLQIKEPLPDYAEPLLLGKLESGPSGDFQTFGFPRLAQVDGINGSGRIYFERVRSTSGLYELLQMKDCKEITRGFSGAPIFHVASARVVGMASWVTVPDDLDRLQETLFAVPSEYIVAVCPELKLHASPDKYYEKLLNGSKKVYSSLTGSSGRFRHLQIATILLPGVKNPELDVEVKLDGGHTGYLESALLGLLQKNTWHSIISGEGGMGKTVSLIKSWDVLVQQQAFLFPIPVFIALNEYNNAEGDDLRHFIFNYIIEKYFGIKSKSADDINGLWNWLESPYTMEDGGYMPKVTLLMDGFNEITVKKDGLLLEIRNDWLAQAKGVQMVITSRQDIRNTLGWEHFTLLELLPLSEKNIQLYLSAAKVPYPENKKLRQVLQNAMMLTIYAASSEIVQNNRSNTQVKFKITVTSYGELLWNFIEAQVLKHSQEHFSDSLRFAEYYFTLKYVLPIAGYQMELRGKYAFSEKEFEQVITQAYEYFGNEKYLESLSGFNAFLEDLEIGKVSLLRSKARFARVAKVICNNLGMMVQEGTAYRFLHQHLRDFFSAMHIIREMSMALNDGELPRVLQERALPVYIRPLIGEVTGEIYHQPVFDKEEMRWSTSAMKKTIIEDALNQCRNRFDLAGKGYIIWNLLTMLSEARFELTGLDLSALDLRNVVLNGIVCSRHFGNQYLATRFDNSLIDPKTILPYYHNRSVNDLCFSPDSKLLASSADGVRFWSMETFQCEGIIGASKYISEITFSADGSHLSGMVYDGVFGEQEIQRWSVSTLRPSGGFRAKTAKGLGCAFSHDGKLVAVGLENDIAVYSMDTYKLIAQLKGHRTLVYRIAFSPDDSKLVSSTYHYEGEGNCEIRLWSLSRKECMALLYDGRQVITCLAFSPDGKLIAGASSGMVRFWASETCVVVNTISDGGLLRHFCFSIDNRMLAIATMYGVYVYGLTNFEKMAVFRVFMETCGAVAFSPDGKMLAGFFEQYNNIRIWSMVTMESLQVLEGRSSYIECLKFSPDGQWMAFGSSDGTISLWSVASGKCITTFKTEAKEIVALSFSPDGQYIAACALHGTCQFWTVATGACVIFESDTFRINDDIEFSHDGAYIAVNTSIGTYLWRASTLECIGKFEGETHSSAGIAFGRNDKYLYVGADHSIELLSIETFEKMAEVKCGEFKSSLMVGPDGKYFVVGVHQSIHVWSVDSLELASVLEGHQEPVRSIAFSPDGKLLASCASGNDGVDRDIYIWSMETFTRETVLKNNGKQRLTSLDFSPDGETIAASDEDGRIMSWSVKTAEMRDRVLIYKTGMHYQGCSFKNVQTIPEIKALFETNSAITG